MSLLIRRLIIQVFNICRKIREFYGLDAKDREIIEEFKNGGLIKIR